MTDKKECPATLRNKQIVIVGGGPSGLTLARLLQMNGADVQLFESDISSAGRNQGGALDLHEDSGQLAMRKAGLFDQFLAASRPEGQATKVFDKHGKIYIDFGREDEQTFRPEIDRGVLRELLLGSLDPGTVKWNRRLQHVERTPNERLHLIFEGGSDAEADLLFGCDGAWSKVRPLVSPTRPYYSGVSFIESRISDADQSHPGVAALVGQGSILATSDNRALLAQRNGDGNIRLYVTFRELEGWIDLLGLDFDRPAEVRKTLLPFFEGWAPHLVEMLRVSDDYFVPRPLYTLPPEQEWSSQPDATLLGDAAHVMPPFTGRGANLAMLDSVELAEALTSGRYPDASTAIRTYETAMLGRMKDAITEVLRDQDVFISPVAPEGVVELMQRRRQST